MIWYPYCLRPPPKGKDEAWQGPENWIPAASISRCDWINLFLSSRILHSIILLAKVGRTNRSEDQEWATCEASPRPPALVCHCWVYTCWKQSRCQQNECKPHNQAATDRWTASLVTSRSDFPALLGIHCSISGRLNVETSEIFSRCFVSIRNQHCKICKVSWSSNTADRIMSCCHCELNVKPTMGWVDFWKARENSVLATTTGLSKFQNQMRFWTNIWQPTERLELLNSWPVPGAMVFESPATVRTVSRGREPGDAYYTRATATVSITTTMTMNR